MPSFLPISAFIHRHLSTGVGIMIHRVRFSLLSVFSCVAMNSRALFKTEADSRSLESLRLLRHDPVCQVAGSGLNLVDGT
jgi:hypothetical protein